ncbi:hypothetical protein [Synechococcus sp. RSCCF101]|uniref:hypothetical protein n=1 Tax=Synechococcus sp. RSCCF101 TaxID=2511069 RepID=UPI0017813ABD|nr:hypothetical protein [Synechococcus sp. RSCCF101]
MGRLWMLAGTGDGPPLAAALLARGWRIQLSVVSASAAEAYPRMRRWRCGWAR